jgi:hypothetical protein
MLRAGLFAAIVVTAACGAYRQDASSPGGPNACREDGKSCTGSAECCSGWCASWVCERKLASRGREGGEGTLE